MFINNKYTKIYYQIINAANTEMRKKNNGLYYELHHIIPRSLGGINSDQNTVLLTGREHFLCHLLLPKMLLNKTDVASMLNALGFMMWAENEFQERYRITSRLYDHLKRKISQSRKNKTVSQETRMKISDSRRGKPSWNKGIPRSIETKSKISESIKKRGGWTAENNPMFGKKHSAKTKSKISNGNSGKVRSNELKQKLSAIALNNGATPPNPKGSIWIYDPVTMATKQWFGQEIPEGWLKGRGRHGGSKFRSDDMRAAMRAGIQASKQRKLQSKDNSSTA